MTKLYVENLNRELEVGEVVRVYDIWDETGDLEELVESGSISPDNENVIAFEIVEENEEIGESLVKITDIY